MNVIEQLDHFEESQEQKLRIASTKTEERKVDIESQNASLVINIDRSFQKLHDVLARREQELLEEVSQLKEEKLGRLQLQKEELETQIFEFQASVADKKSLIENATDIALQLLRLKCQGG